MEQRPIRTHVHATFHFGKVVLESGEEKACRQWLCGDGFHKLPFYAFPAVCMCLHSGHEKRFDLRCGFRLRLSTTGKVPGAELSCSCDTSWRVGPRTTLALLMAVLGRRDKFGCHYFRASTIVYAGTVSSKPP